MDLAVHIYITHEIAFFFLLAVTVAFNGPLVAKEKLPTAEQRFGGKTEQAESPSFRRHVVPLASKLAAVGASATVRFKDAAIFS